MKRTPPELAAEAARRTAQSLDAARPEAVSKRHGRGFRSARENLEALCDPGSFLEYGQLAVAAQRGRRAAGELARDTAADGVITGTATMNRALFGERPSRVALAINDYSVLAGTQGYFHHQKLDRLLGLAAGEALPVIMFTEGGGGRPGDVDVTTQIAGLNVPTFASWGLLAERSPLIAVTNGYCFAGNAALFGGADLRIATRSSWTGMAGPAMIAGGGLGEFEPTDIGPVEVQQANGVIDVVADDEAQAAELARRVVGYWQGALADWNAADQRELSRALPDERRMTYDVRALIATLADCGTFIELRAGFGRSLVTAFARVGGVPVGLMANDCKVLAGAIDTEAAIKATDFLRLLRKWRLPLVSLVDTPGFMVGPDSERAGAVRAMPAMMAAGAQLGSRIVCIVLRRAYGLGAMAMAGGSLRVPVYCASWPTGEFGAMGLEGAVRLGFRREIEAETDPEERRRLIERLLVEAYERGQACEAAAMLEIDGVIEPAETRRCITTALASLR